MGCKIIFVVLRSFVGEFLGLFFEEFEGVLFVDFFVFGGGDVVVYLLLELGMGNFGCGGVFFVFIVSIVFFCYGM